MTLELPPLPEPCGNLKTDPYEGHIFYPQDPLDWSMLGNDLYTPDQMRAYALAYGALVADAAHEACCGSDVVNVADIRASDSPAVTVMKYRAAIRARGKP